MRPLHFFFLGIAILMQATIQADPPDNDAFASAEMIDGENGSFSATLAEATREPGELQHGAPGAGSVWYEWVAPATSTVSFTTSGSSADTSLAVYTGNSLAGLTKVTENADIGLDVAAKVVFYGTEGVRYWIAVDAPISPDTDFSLSWESVEGDVFLFSPVIYMRGEGGKFATVTVRRVGPAIGNILVSLGAFDGTATADEDFNLVAFETVFASGTRVKTFNVTILDDDFAEEDIEYVFLDVSVLDFPEGVVASEDPDLRTGLLGIVDNDDPPNDDFASSTSIGNATGMATGTTAGSDREALEPDHGRSVWFRWKSPSNGIVRFSTLESDAAPLFIYAYAGTTLNALVPIGDGLDEIVFPVAANETYRIALTDGPTNDGSQDLYTLRWEVLVGASVFDFTSDSFATREKASGGATVTVRRVVTGPAGAASVGWSLVNGSATADADFVGAGGVLDFTTNEVQKSFNIPIVNDALVEGDESFFVVLNSPNPGFLGVRNVASVLIQDDEDDPVNNDFANATVLAGQDGSVPGSTIGADLEPGETAPSGGEIATVWFQWVAPGIGSIDLSVVSSNGASVTVFTGTAVNALTAVTAQGSTVSVDTNTGTTYYVRVHGNSGAFTLNYDFEMTNLPGSLAFLQEGFVAVEGSNAVVTVKRSGGAFGAVTVDYATSPLAAGVGEAVAQGGSDFVPTNGTLTFENGEEEKQILVALPEDTGAESEKGFRMTLQTPGGGASLGAVTTALVRIQDNDVPTLAAVKASYTALVAPPFVGLISLKVLTTGRFTGTLFDGVTKTSLRGQFDAEGRATLTVVSKVDGSLIVHLVQQAGGMELSGTIEARSGSHAFLSGINGGSTPERAGTCTLTFQPDLGDEERAHTGFPQAPIVGVGKLSTAGRLRAALQMPDGSALSVGATGDPQGRVPVLVALAKRRGVFTGQFAFPQSNNVQAAGDFRWMKRSLDSSGLYAFPFSVNAVGRLSRFTKPAPGTLVLPSLPGDGAATFIALSPADFSTALQAEVQIQQGRSSQRIKPVAAGTPNVAGSVAVASGLVRGTFETTFAGSLSAEKKIRYIGVADQQAGRITGFFIGLTEAGTIEVEDAAVSD